MELFRHSGEPIQEEWVYFTCANKNLEVDSN